MARRSFCERWSLETCARNTNRRYTKVGCLGKPWTFETGKGLKFATWHKPFLNIGHLLGRIRPLRTGFTHGPTPCRLVWPRQVRLRVSPLIKHDRRCLAVPVLLFDISPGIEREIALSQWIKQTGSIPIVMVASIRAEQFASVSKVLAQTSPVFLNEHL